MENNELTNEGEALQTAGAADAAAAATDAAADPQSEDATRAELLEACKQRSSTYAFLSRLYRKEVDAELLEELTDLRFRVSHGNADVDEGYRRIATYLSGVWENSETELAADYMRVFFGHGYDGHAAAYPFESIYVSEKRLLMQSARDEVLALYRAAGLDKQPSWKEGEDHLALELEYMQVLTDRTVEALCKGDGDEAVALVKTQANFLDDHLLSWVPMMTAEMKRFAKTEFYQGLAYLTDGFLAIEKELIDELLAE